MKTELDSLATSLYVKTDDLLKAAPHLAPWRPAIGIAPQLTDAELVTLAMMQAMLGFTSEPEHPARLLPFTRLRHAPVVLQVHRQRRLSRERTLGPGAPTLLGQILTPLDQVTHIIANLFQLIRLYLIEQAVKLVPRDAHVLRLPAKPHQGPEVKLWDAVV
ncbi:hypothetical protein AB0H34_28065 [Saccharopolyspora shandongensis]